MTTLARETEQGSVRPNLAKTLFATCIGNALEWFDIAVYGFFASYIAQVFFPDVQSNGLAAARVRQLWYRLFDSPAGGGGAWRLCR